MYGMDWNGSSGWSRYWAPYSAKNQLFHRHWNLAIIQLVEVDCDGDCGVELECDDDVDCGLLTVECGTWWRGFCQEWKQGKRPRCSRCLRKRKSFWTAKQWLLSGQKSWMVVLDAIPGLWMSCQQRGRWGSLRRRWGRGGCSSRRCCRGTRGAGSPFPSSHKLTGPRCSTPRTGSWTLWNCKFWPQIFKILTGILRNPNKSHISPRHVQQPESEGGSDQDGGEVALLGRRKLT